MRTLLPLIALLPVQPQTQQSPAPDLAPLSSFAWGDLDGDALPDALVLTPGLPARLLVNRGEGQFVDDTTRCGLPQVTGVTQAHWQDVDLDGRLDLLLVVPGGESRLLLNRPGGLLEDVSVPGQLTGVDASGARFVQLDGDLLPDLELVGPRRDLLLRNLGAGRFETLELDLQERPRTVAPALPTPAESASTSPRTVAPAEDSARTLDGERAGSPPTGSAPLSVGSVGAGLRPSSSSAVFCAPTLLDQSSASCLEASSMPTLGRLYPLTTDLNVDLAGRVGVGTSAPTHRLTIQAQTGDDALRLIGTQGGFGHGARLNLGDGDYVHLWEYDDDRLEIKGDKEVLISSVTGEVNVATAKFNVVAAGGVRVITGLMGIGPIVPLWPLHISAPQGVVRLDSTSATNGSVVELRNQTASPTNIGAVNFVNATGATPGQIAYTGANDLTLRTNSVERMRIDSAGKVQFKGDEVVVGAGLVLPIARLLVNGVASLSSLGNQGLASATLKTENTSTGLGIALYGVSSGTDATAVLTQKGSGAILRGFNGPESGGTLVFEVRKSGRVVTTALQITGGGDLVEAFDTGGELCPPGSVVAIDPARPGELMLARRAYDRRVAGVVSGAGGVRPGIELVQEGVLEGATQVAMAGRVYVRCSTENGPIEPGDLLTSASLAGHAMCADDPARAFGAVIGKAMTPLEQGQGLVLVLVNLQ